MAHNLMQTEVVNAVGLPETFTHFVCAAEADQYRWHGLGLVHPSLFTPKEGLALLGGPRVVRKVPLTFTNLAGLPQTSERAYLILGPEDQEYAAVGADYTPFQEEQIAEVLDVAFGENSQKLLTFGRLGQGERVFWSSKLGRAEVRDPHEGWSEAVDHILVVDTSHDGTRAFSFRLTTVVPVCQNTINLGERKQRAECRLLHTQDIQAQAKAVARVLGSTGKFVESFNEAVKTLFELRDVNADDVALYSRLCIPHAPSDTDPTQDVPGVVRGRREAITEAYYLAPGCVNTPETGFRLYQAATRANQRFRKNGWAQEQFQPASVDFRETAYQSVLTLMEMAQS